MTSRRRVDDSTRLYDLAKKYQENQNSSELVKKQNATEEKVLSVRLAYLNNQKELIKKTMEKEIELVQRNSLSGRETSGKNRASYQMDRAASLPSTVGSTRENLAERESSLLVTPQELTPYYCNGIDSREQASKQRENVEVDPRKKTTDSYFQQTTCVIRPEIYTTGNSTRVCSSQINGSSSTKRQARNVSLNTSSSKTKPCYGDSTPRGHLTNDEAENVERKGLQLKHDRCHTSFHYSQTLEARRQAWMRMPTPFPKLEREGNLTNGTLVQTSRVATDGRNNQLRFSRTMSSHIPSRSLTPRKTKSYNAIGAACKDLRFKKLESLLEPY